MITPARQTPLSAGQFELEGFLFGKDTQVPVGEIEGLGAPEVRDQDVDNPSGDGVFPGQDFYGVRTLRFEAGIKTPGDTAAAAGLLAQLNHAANSPSVRTRPGSMALLRARWPGHDTRRVYGRVRRVEVTSGAKAVHGWLPLDIEFAAMEPYWLADEESCLQLPLDQAVSAPGDLFLGCPPESGAHQVSALRPGWVANLGDVPSWPDVTVHGPVTNPRIWNTVNHAVLELGLTLRTGEWVELQTRPGTRWALRNGTTNTANELTPASRLDRFTIPPGRSEIGWSGEDPTGTSHVDLTWRSAYTTL